MYVEHESSTQTMWEHVTIRDICSSKELADAAWVALEGTQLSLRESKKRNREGGTGRWNALRGSHRHASPCWSPIHAMPPLGSRDGMALTPKISWMGRIAIPTCRESKGTEIIRRKARDSTPERMLPQSHPMGILDCTRPAHLLSLYLHAATHLQ